MTICLQLDEMMVSALVILQNANSVHIGEAADPSFQLAHALWAIERVLKDLLSRGAVFDIVFWHGKTCQTFFTVHVSPYTYLALRHLSVETGSSSFVVASRQFARVSMFHHLCQMEQLQVYTFVDLSDSDWITYRSIRKARRKQYSLKCF
jgi:hypothetical protein